MFIVADTHVHFYPVCDMVEALRRLSDNLARHAGNAEHVNVACLAERHDCRWFQSAKDAGTGAPDGWQIESAASDDNSLVFTRDGTSPLYVIAGRQIVTRERLEILSLTSDAEIPHGLPASETTQAILDNHAVPVLSWAAGKWLFSRGKLARNLIEDSAPGKLLVGDTTVRPASWREPAAMALARNRGLTLVAGSDPLPFAGEERYMGTYCSVFEGDFDSSSPAASLRELLLSTRPVVRSEGRRCALFESFRRAILLPKLGALRSSR